MNTLFDESLDGFYTVCSCVYIACTDTELKQRKRGLGGVLLKPYQQQMPDDVFGKSKDASSILQCSYQLGNMASPVMSIPLSSGLVKHLKTSGSYLCYSI